MHDGLTGTVVGLALAAAAGILGCAHPPPAGAGAGADQSEERRLAGANGWLLGRSLGLGPGFAVIFVHGVGGNNHLFDPQMAEFRGGRRVLAFDQRGCGGSADAPAGGGYDLDTRVRDLSNLLDAMRLDPVALVGHGTGAQVVARYAERNPDRVLGLVLINPVSGNAEAGRIADLSEAQFRPAVETWLGTLLDGATPETKQVVVASVLVARVPAMRSMLADAAGQDLPASLAAYPGPVLILAAPDEAIPGPLREGIEVKRLSGGSHWSPLDAPDQVNAEIRAFLRPLDATRPRRGSG
jgi:pimeloyl-ACP methyl ester carboxylesterase